MIEILVTVINILDDSSYPCVVEAKLVDYFGKTHTFIDKDVIFSKREIHQCDLPYSCVIRGEIIDENFDKVDISTENPDALESSEGLSRFTINCDKIVNRN